MRHEALWDRTGEETLADLDRALRRGAAMVSLCSYGEGDRLRHATVWQADRRAAQRFEAGVAPGLAAGVIHRHARDGFHPVLVGMAGPADRPVLAFVFERTPPGVTPPRFVPPRPFRDDDGTFFLTRAAGDGPRDGGLLTTVAAAGAPRDASGAGLLVAGIWAPQPEIRVAWSVHLDEVPEGCWRDRWEPRVLETVARPVMAIPIEADRRWVLSLWHDRVSESWPEPDPFAPARRFEASEVTGSAHLERAVEERRAREDRRVISLGAAVGSQGARFLALYGSAGTEAPLPRRFAMAAPGDEAPREVDPDHPLDRWARDHMRATGARHGQMVVVRGRRLAFARAYTLAEAGYPAATLDHALRLGSVSKPLTALALLGALSARGLGVDARVTELLGFAPGEGPPRFEGVTVRHLLAHRAGLRSFADVRPDEPRNPLSERALTTLLDGAPAPARPGQLSLGLRALRDDAVLGRAPGGEAAYSNEGFILLGELLAHLDRGSVEAYEPAVIDRLLRGAGVDPGERGCLFGAGRRRARHRHESPAHPSSPTWAPRRFPDDDESPLVPAPYADNGPFLGGAAGWSGPLIWLARILAMLPRRDVEIGLGFHLDEPGWWTFRGKDGPSTTRVERMHHNGRLDGGAALLIHQMPHDAGADALDATLSIAVAFNQLGPLFEDPHGRQLLAIVRGLESGPSAERWSREDLFSLTPPSP